LSSSCKQKARGIGLLRQFWLTTLLLRVVVVVDMKFGTQAQVAGAAQEATELQLISPSHRVHQLQ
jgi:hypothetical protein